MAISFTALIEVNGITGQTRAVITEESKTFINYRPLVNNPRDTGKKVRYEIDDGKEIIWMSERDGWAHLYLYDGVTGRVKNQITKGNWLVRNVEKVDEAKRQIWFQASGMYPGKDPYFMHYYRINFDGTGLTTLTEADANHAVTFSTDMKYYVDTLFACRSGAGVRTSPHRRQQRPAHARTGRHLCPARCRLARTRSVSPRWDVTAKPTSGASSSGR